MSGFYNIEGSSPFGDGCCRRMGSCPDGMSCGSGCKCSRSADMREYSEDTYSNHPGILSWIMPIPAALSNWYDNAKMKKWRSSTAAKSASKQAELDALALEKSEQLQAEKDRIEAEFQAERRKMFEKDPAKEELKRKQKIVKASLFIGIPVLLVGIMMWATYKNKK